MDCAKKYSDPSFERPLKKNIKKGVVSHWHRLLQGRNMVVTNWLQLCNYQVNAMYLQYETTPFERPFFVFKVVSQKRDYCIT